MLKVSIVISDAVQSLMRALAALYLDDRAGEGLAVDSPKDPRVVERVQWQETLWQRLEFLFTIIIILGSCLIAPCPERVLVVPPGV